MHPFALDHTSTVYSAPLQVVAATRKSAEASQEIPIDVRSARNFSVSLSEPSHHSRSIKTHRTKRLWVESRAVLLLRGFFPLRRGASLVDAPPQRKTGKLRQSDLSTGTWCAARGGHKFVSPAAFHHRNAAGDTFFVPSVLAERQSSICDVARSQRTRMVGTRVRRGQKCRVKSKPKRDGPGPLL